MPLTTGANACLRLTFVCFGVMMFASGQRIVSRPIIKTHFTTRCGILGKSRTKPDSRSFYRSLRRRNDGIGPCNAMKERFEDGDNAHLPCNCNDCTPERRRDFVGKNTVAATTAAAALSVFWWQSTRNGEMLGLLGNPKKSFAWCMANRMGSYERAVNQEKEKIFDQLFTTLEGGSKILEIGVGPGPNMKMYKRSFPISVVGLDSNVHMANFAQESAEVNIDVLTHLIDIEVKSFSPRKMGFLSTSSLGI